MCHTPVAVGLGFGSAEGQDSPSPPTGNGVSEEILAELTAALRDGEPGPTLLSGRLNLLNGRSGVLVASALGSGLLLIAVLALTLLGLLL